MLCLQINSNQYINVYINHIVIEMWFKIAAKFQAQDLVQKKMKTQKQINGKNVVNIGS